MQMKISSYILLIIALTIAIGCKQRPNYHPIKNIGDNVPTLRVKKWLKGEPVKEFEKGKVYVVEFWATWCVPCKASMPRLSALAKQYKGQATFIAMDVFEQETGTTIAQVQAVVNAMGDKMNFPVAAEDSNFMARDWLKSAGEFSIPNTYIIDRDGKVAWIGHPKDLDKVLPKVMNNTWDINAALSKRNLEVKLTKLDELLNDQANKYVGYWNNNTQSNDFGRPDSTLLAIDSMVKIEPRLKFRPNTVYLTLYSQLKTNRLNDAYQYGKQAMASTGTDKEELYSNLITAIRHIEENYHQIKITPGIYQIAAECQQKLLDIQPYPELVDYPAKYKKIAM
jgi:thiol-disulfide isomerase/thioredoxin